MDVDELVAVVPLRSPGAGKTRLAPALDTDTRAALAGAMLADVVAALRGAGVEVVVAAGGPAAAAAASALQVTAVVDPPTTRSLDAALEHARRTVAPTASLLVVQADLPLLRPADVHALLDADAPVVLAPTHDGGTSALLRRPSSVIATAYGPHSADHHRRLAREAGVPVSVVERPGLALDVDRLEDLDALVGREVGPATRAVLGALQPGSWACA